MILSTEQAGLFYVPTLANDLHLSLINDSPLFFRYIPFLQIGTMDWRRTYRLEADVTDNTQYTSPLRPEAIPIDVAAMPVHGYGLRPRSRQGQWRLTKIVTPFTEDADEDLAGSMINQHANNIFTHLENMGRSLVVDIIEQTGIPAPDRMGGIVSNLASWDNTIPALTQGYGADVLAQQTIVHNATIWGWDATAGGVTADDITVLNRAIGLVRPRPTAIIVPERFVWAMVNSYMRRGANVPEILIDVQRFGAIQPTREPMYNFKGIPFIVVPDALYTAAGHDVTSTPGDYDIYVIRGADPGNLFSGASVLFKGQIMADRPEAVTIGSPTMNMGTGVILEKHGKLYDETGIRDAYVRELSARYQFCLGTPQSAAIIQGVQD